MIALDLFAGSGWAVACRWVGIRDLGVELMPEARGTRDLNGFETPFDDVSLLQNHQLRNLGIKIHIGSPPCQTYSVSGKGQGREALDRVIIGAKQIAVGKMWRPQDDDDPRTWLALEPLRLLLMQMPEYFIWEQVPTVLPVWEVCADIARSVGYHTVTGIVNSEQYGVPQTRRRAVIMGRLSKSIGFPQPTHSQYYVNDPLRMDSGVLPWVSMAQALGWADGVVGFPRLADDAETITIGGEQYRARDMHPTSRPAPNLTEKARSWKRFYRNGNQANAAVRSVDSPAPTIMFGARLNATDWLPGGERVTIVEAAALQTFPPDHKFAGSKTKVYLQIGNAVPPLLGKVLLEHLLL